MTNEDCATTLESGRYGQAVTPGANSPPGGAPIFSAAAPSRTTPRIFSWVKARAAAAKNAGASRSPAVLVVMTTGGGPLDRNAPRSGGSIQPRGSSHGV